MKDKVSPAWILKELQKIAKREELKKSVGRITFPKIEPKLTRPDQEIQTISQDELGQTGVPHYEIAAKKILNKISHFFGQKYPESAVKQLADGVKYYSDADQGAVFSSSSGEPLLGIRGNGGDPWVAEHEGFHFLIRHISNRYNLNHDSIYSKLNTMIHPDVVNVLEPALEKHRGYSGESANREKVTSLRDMLVNKGWRDQVLESVPKEAHQSLTTKAKISFRNIRKYAERLSFEDLDGFKKSNSAKEETSLQGWEDGLCPVANELKNFLLSEKSNDYNRLKKTIVSTAPDLGIDDIINYYKRKHPEKYQKFIDSLDRSDNKLEKSPGRIAPKQLESKFTRPDQEVKELHDPGNPGSPTFRRYDKIFRSNFGHQDDEIKDDSSVGIFMPGVGGFAHAGQKQVIEHEGHHALVDKLVQKYGIDPIHNLYQNSVKEINPKVNDFVHRVLKGDQNYSKMESHPDKSYQLAFVEEKINLLRDFVHGKAGQNEALPKNKQEFSRRELLTGLKDKDGFAKIRGFDSWHHMDTEIKKAWIQIRNKINNTKPEDL